MPEFSIIALIKLLRQNISTNDHSFIEVTSLELPPITVTSFKMLYTVFRYETVQEKSYNKTYVTSKDSYYPAHLCSLIRAFANHMCLLQPSDYPKTDKQEPLPYWVDEQAYPSLCWLHRSYCRFCCVLAHM